MWTREQLEPEIDDIRARLNRHRRSLSTWFVNRSVEVDPAEVDSLAPDPGDLVHTPLDCREHSQSQQVDLQEARVGTGILVPHRHLATLDRRRDHRATVDQRARGDDHASGVLGEMARLGGTQFDPAMLQHFLRVDLADYDAMNLAEKKRSLHYTQADGYVHALDLRTKGRSEAWNGWAKTYFELMGFRTLRHSGTEDHLHISLKIHDNPAAL